MKNSYWEKRWSSWSLHKRTWSDRSEFGLVSTGLSGDKTDNITMKRHLVANSDVWKHWNSNQLQISWTHTRVQKQRVSLKECLYCCVHTNNLWIQQIFSNLLIQQSAAREHLCNSEDRSVILKKLNVQTLSNTEQLFKHVWAVASKLYSFHTFTFKVPLKQLGSWKLSL